MQAKPIYKTKRYMGAEVRGSSPCLATTISEIGYLLLPSRDMAEILLQRRKFNQPTKT